MPRVDGGVTDLPAGSMFAGYRIEGLLGRGGMGVVYCASDLGLERRVALKLLSAELSRNAGFRRRFQAESKVAASLEHPNVIPIFAAGEHESVLYLAMRYVEGEDLREAIAEQGRLQPDRAVHILAQVASALDAAHAKGLVHRDVKPANVMLAAGDHVYLTDFGLTKRLLADSEETVTDQLLGTLDYVAPEQIRAAELGPYTDVYALGCVFFQMLCGHAPFAGLEREAKLWAHVSEAPPALGPDVSPQLDRIVTKAMAKDPGERFSSAGELAESAVEALAREPSFKGRVRASVPSVIGAAPRRSRSRLAFRRALIARAIFSPFSLLILGGVLLTGALLGALGLAAPIAVVLYLAAVWSVCRDPDVRGKVRDRQRAKRIAAGAFEARSEEGAPVDIESGLEKER
jgi:serine/threonine protein kinase